MKHYCWWMGLKGDSTLLNHFCRLSSCSESGVWTTHSTGLTLPKLKIRVNNAEFPCSCPALTRSCPVPPKKRSRVMIWQHFLVPCAGLYPRRAILYLKHLPVVVGMNCSGCHFLLLGFINKPSLCLERKTVARLGFSFFSCEVIVSNAAPVCSTAPSGAFLLVVHCAPQHS